MQSRAESVARLAWPCPPPKQQGPPGAGAAAGRGWGARVGPGLLPCSAACPNPGHFSPTLGSTEKEKGVETAG